MEVLDNTDNVFRFPQSIRQWFFMDELSAEQERQRDKYRILFQSRAAFISSLLVLIFFPLIYFFNIITIKPYFSETDFDLYLLLLAINYLFYLGCAIIFRQYLVRRNLYEKSKQFKTLLFFFIIMLTSMNWFSTFIAYSYGAELIQLVYVPAFVATCMVLNHKERFIYLFSLCVAFVVSYLLIVDSNNTFITDTIFAAIAGLFYFYIFGAIIYRTWLLWILHRVELKDSLIKLQSKNSLVSGIVKDQKKILQSLHKQLNIESSFDQEENSPNLLNNELKALFQKLYDKEKEAEELKNKYKDIFHNIYDGIIILDNRWKILDINKKGTEILGVDKAAVIDQPIAHFFKIKNNTEVKRFQEELQKSGVYSNFELEVTDLKGKKRFLEISSSAIYKYDKYVGSRNIFRDITERKATENALIKARKTEKNFLANMSHEIRTPLNAIIGMSYLLYDTNPNDQQKELIHAINHSSEFLYNLISDILDIAKLESKKIEFQQKDVDLIGLLKSIEKSFTIKLSNEPIEFILEIDKTIKNYYKTDPTVLTQVLYNLLNNAEKFTDQGFIKLVVSDIGQKNGDPLLQFEVMDTGIGIKGKNINQIFKKFFQIPKNKAAKTRGTGLGLAICKQIIDHVGGQIFIDSVYSKGTTVRFTFPMETTKNGATPYLLKVPKSRNFKTNTSLKQLSYLIVEDNIMNQKYISTLLDNHNMEYDIAHDGIEAFELCNQKKYDCILMDIQMPKQNGIETSIAIRNSNSPNQNTIIIALTASVLSEQKAECLEAGMNDFLAKPFTPEKLFEKLNSNLINLNLMNKNQELFKLNEPYIKANEDIVSELETIFWNEENLKEIKSILTHIDDGSFELAKRQLHKVKPSFEMVGLSGIFKELAKIYNEMNPSIEHDQIQKLRNILEDFFENKEDLQKEIKYILQE